MKLDTEGDAAAPVALPQPPLRPYPEFEHEIGAIFSADDVNSGVPSPSRSNNIDSHSESGIVDTAVDMTSSCTINVYHASNLPGVVGSTPSPDDGMPAVEGV